MNASGGWTRSGEAIQVQERMAMGIHYNILPYNAPASQSCRSFPLLLFSSCSLGQSMSLGQSSFRCPFRQQAVFGGIWKPNHCFRIEAALGKPTEVYNSIQHKCTTEKGAKYPPFRSGISTRTLHDGGKGVQNSLVALRAMLHFLGGVLCRESGAPPPIPRRRTQKKIKKLFQKVYKIAWDKKIP